MARAERRARHHPLLHSFCEIDQVVAVDRDRRAPTRREASGARLFRASAGMGVADEDLVTHAKVRDVLVQLPPGPRKPKALLSSGSSSVVVRGRCSPDLSVYYRRGGGGVKPHNNTTALRGKVGNRYTVVEWGAQIGRASRRYWPPESASRSLARLVDRLAENLRIADHFLAAWSAAFSSARAPARILIRATFPS